MFVLTVLYLKASVFINFNMLQSYYLRNRRNIATVYFCPGQEDINSQQNIRQDHIIQSFHQKIRNTRRILMKNLKFKESQHLIKRGTSNHSFNVA